MLVRERARDREGWGLINWFIHSKELSHAILGTLLSVTIVLPFSQCQLNIIILYLVVWIYDSWFLHLSADEHLNSYIWHLWIMLIWIFLCTSELNKFSFLLGWYLVELLDCMVSVCIFNFLRNFLSIFQSGFILLYCHQQFKRIPVLPQPANT